MASKKQQDKLSTEDLINLLDHKETEGEEEYTITDSILVFLTQNGIEPGKELISIHKLINLYRDWSGDKTTHLSTLSNKFHTYLPKIGRRHFGCQLKFVDIIKLLNKPFKKYRQSAQRRLAVRPNVSPHYVKNFEDFIKDYTVKKGSTWIEWFILYYLYDKWAYDNKRKTRVTEYVFKEFCRLYFNIRITKEDNMFWIQIDEKDIKHLTSQIASEIRGGYIWKNERKKLKKIKG